jgi:hypothetical protein
MKLLLNLLILPPIFPPIVGDCLEMYGRDSSRLVIIRPAPRVGEMPRPLSCASRRRQDSVEFDSSGFFITPRGKTAVYTPSINF